MSFQSILGASAMIRANTKTASVEDFAAAEVLAEPVADRAITSRPQERHNLYIFQSLRERG